MQELRSFLAAGQAGTKEEAGRGAVEDFFPRDTGKEPVDSMENLFSDDAVDETQAISMETDQESGQNRRYFRVRLTIAALLFLFFAAGVYFRCLPDWLTKERVRDAFADNSLAQYLEEEAAKVLASSDLSKEKSN